MYSKSLRKLFKKEKIDIGDEIEVLRGKETYRGILMPRTMGDDKTIVLKLDNGYNIGIKSKKVNLVSKSKKKEEEPEAKKEKPSPEEEGKEGKSKEERGKAEPEPEKKPEPPPSTEKKE